MQNGQSAAWWITTLALCTGASGQDLIRRHEGDESGNRLGSALATIGDLDGDMIGDYLVGAPGETDRPGFGRVFSGATGEEIRTHLGLANGDAFGSDVRGAGDVNGDSLTDYLIGIPGDDQFFPDGGRVVVLANDGSTLYELFGSINEAAFGNSVCGIGDLDGDGDGEFVIGAPGDRDTLVDEGSVRIFSGVDGTERVALYGGQAGAAFGHSVASIADLDNDGAHDLLVGAPGDSNTLTREGSVRVFSGRTEAPLFRFDGGIVDIELGEVVRAAGDVNRDGFVDVIAGAPEGAIARVYSGQDGSVLADHSLSVGTRFGSSVNAAGDINVDGFADYLIGAPRELVNGDDGTARIYSGRHGTVLFRFKDDDRFGDFGFAASCAGDINGDALPDILIGANSDDDNGTNSGSARVYAGNDLFLAANATQLDEGDLLVLTTRERDEGSVLALMLLSVDGVDLPQPIEIGVFDSSGTHVYSRQIPRGFSGLEFGFQCFVCSDPSADRGVSDSSIVTIEIQ